MDKVSYQNSEFSYAPTPNSTSRLFNKSNNRYIQIAIFIFTLLSITFLVEINNNRNNSLDEYSTKSGFSIENFYKI